MSYLKNGKEVGVVFINSTCTLERYFENKKVEGDVKDITISNSIERRNIATTFKLTDSNIPNYFEVYYTTIDFKKIRKVATNEELEKIINKSNLMYKSE